LTELVNGVIIALTSLVNEVGGDAVNEKFYSLSKEKQSAIINSAMCVFSAGGYKKALTEEIAKEAGVSKGLLFHYFGSKQKLYLFLYDYCIRYIKERMDFETGKAKPDYFDFLIETQLMKREIMKQHPYIFCFASTVYYDDAPEISRLVKSTNRELISSQIDFLLDYADCSHFKSGVDARKITEIIIWTAEGMMKDIMSRPTVDIDKASDEYLEILRIFKNNFYREEYADGDN
jgi:AcrR family transcriptional regulator